MTNVFIDIIILMGYIFLNTNIKRRYKLYRDFNNNKEIKISNPNMFKTKLNNMDKERLMNLTLGNDVLSFKKTLEKNVNNKYLNNLYNNLKTIRIEEKYILFRNLLLQPVGGFYAHKKNKIEFLKFLKSDVINHELFHMASTTYNSDDEMYLCGFAQYNKNFTKIFGVGLNEGYTELLAERYFGKNYNASKVYKLCEFYSNKLEEIIGKEKMTNLFLNADLPRLIETLKKYDSEENIIEFIYNLDFIIKHMSSLSNPIIIGKDIFREKITKKLSKINNSLIKWYIETKNNDLKEKKIKQQQFIKYIKEYYKSIKMYTLFDESLNIHIKQLSYEELEKLDIPTKKIKTYPQVKEIKKRYNR